MGKNPERKANPQTCAISAAKVATIFIAIFCAVLLSCQKKSARALEERTELSKKIEEAREKAAWAYEIEGERLSKKISSVDSIDRSIPLEPLALVALEGGKSFLAIFPELEGFTSLDTRDIQGEALDTVNGFCRALIEYTSQPPESDLKEIEKAEKENGGTEEESEKSGQKDSSKIDGYFSENTLFSLVLFLADSETAGAMKSFIVGRPFVGEENIEVPIRLSCENATVYALAYPAPNEESWKIQQIEIYKVEEKNGKTHGN